MGKIRTSRGDLKFKSRILYLGIKQIDREQALENLKEVYSVISKTKLHWGPIFGTLLGIVRENNFIEWDEDIDLYIKEEEEELFKDTLWDLKALGFEIIRYERRGLYSIMKRGEYIDFYVLKKISPTLRHAGGWEFIFDKYITDTVIHDFKGIRFEIPREYDEFLTFHYGDWRTPVKWANYQMNPFQKFKAKAIFYIKNNIPDFMYYYLIDRYHRKDLEKFKQKCIKKGCPIEDGVKLDYKRRLRK